MNSKKGEDDMGNKDNSKNYDLINNKSKTL